MILSPMPCSCAGADISNESAAIEDCRVPVVLDVEHDGRIWVR